MPACLTYALAVPRMKPYSYILLLIPTLALIRLLPRCTLVPAASAALAALVVFPLGNSLLPFRSLSQLLYEYMSLAGALVAWVGFHQVLNRSLEGAQEASSTLGGLDDAQAHQGGSLGA